MDKKPLTRSILKVLFLLAAIGVQAVFAAKHSVAVLPSEGEGVFNASQLKFFTDKAQEIAVKVLPQSDFDVVPQSVVIRRLGGVENYVKECKESSCIVQLGRKAMVDYVAQCSFTKLSGSDFTVSFELYDVSTEGLIDKFTETAKNFNGLRAIVEKRIPEGFKKIPGAAPEAKTSLPPADGEAGTSPKAKTAPPSVDSEIKGGVFTDSRDGKKYRTVKIGTQTWIAENLNYAASGSKCYDNKPENCAKYGRLYDWATAKNVCPSGWHLPSKSEYETLDKYVGGEIVAGKKLKAKRGWYENGNGTDEFDFSALPGGIGYSGGNFYSVGDRGYWWSASEITSYYAYYRGMSYFNNYTDWYDGEKHRLLSVRCVLDSFMKIPGAAPTPQAEIPPPSGNADSGMFTDSRDGKKYKTVKIGRQTWMAENLNFAVKGSKCYDNKPENCQKYGRLYDWTTAKKVCPSGWHLPSISEYEVLYKAVGGKKVAGKKLKARSGWNWNDLDGKSGNGTDEFGFSALPGSQGYSDGSFGNDVGYKGYWWSTSDDEDISVSAFDDDIGDLLDLNALDDDYEYRLQSVRCLQDY
jgi:uncharacterized protein (TIGR02145 family)